MSNRRKICGTCKHWNFGVEVEGSWGNCLNQKVKDSMYISVGLPKSSKKPNDYQQFIEDVSTTCEVRFEENNFGCIHWKKDK